MSEQSLDFQTQPVTPVVGAAPDDRAESTPFPSEDRDNEELSVCAAFWAY
jgi:hypothetical protein